MAARRSYGADARQAKDGGTRMAWGLGFLSLACAPVGGQDRATFGAFPCRLTERQTETLDIPGPRLPTTRVTERCKSPEYAVTNTYWLGPEGTIRKSRQWAGPDLGSITVERLIR